MPSLSEDLQRKKATLQEFNQISKRILNYLPNVLSGSYKKKSVYRLYSSLTAGTLKFVRPINEVLFYFEENEFDNAFSEFLVILDKIKQKKEISTKEESTIDRVVYTIQQSIGCGLDLLVEPNSARKHVGNRFEELINAIFNELEINNVRLVLQIPYETDEGEKIYKCENDLILSPHPIAKSSSISLDESEIVVSVKTTSKDRMGKMFIDKILLEKFVGHPQKVIGIFLNDVQRKNTDNISHTLVSGLFMVYTKFLTQLDGIYYLDLPPNALKDPYRKHMKQFSKLLAIDVWKLLSS